MKTMFKMAWSILLTFSLMSSTCSSDDDGSSGSSASTQAIINTAQSGDWVITYFYDTDQEETNNYNGYTFNFGSNGVLTATNGSNTITGTWSVTNSSNSSDDDGNSDIDFNIFFASPANFNELSDDWHIIQYSSTKIELIDVSGGNGGTDYLTFEKQ